MNYAVAEALKAKIAKLDALFDRMVESDIASTEQQQAVIDRIDYLKDQLDEATRYTVTNWSQELASLNID